MTTRGANATDQTKGAEGKAKFFAPKGVFYNPEMKLCRDVSVLAVRAVLEGKKVRAVDATSGSGIRSIRYFKECANSIGELFLVDINPSAINSSKANLKLNKIRVGKTKVAQAKTVFSSFSRFANSANAKGGFGLVELDPFGSPVPFLYDAIRISRGGTLLSATATDTAVLCGAHPAACLKNYQSKPLNNWCCHEIGIRILLAKIIRTASEFNLGIKPLFSLSHRHYFKVFVLLEKGAESAVDSIKQTGFAGHCNKCLYTETRKGVANPIREKCPICGESLEFAGPLWLGEIQDKDTVERMIKIKDKSSSGLDERLSKMLPLISSECGMPSLYFELHKVTERLGVNAVKPDSVAHELKKAGFVVGFTHFEPNSLKTDAGILDVIKAIKAVNSKSNLNSRKRKVSS